MHGWMAGKSNAAHMKCATGRVSRFFIASFEPINPIRILYHGDHSRTLNRGDILTGCVDGLSRRSCRFEFSDDAPRANKSWHNKIIDDVSYLVRSRPGVNAVHMLILISSYLRALWRRASIIVRWVIQSNPESLFRMLNGDVYVCLARSIGLEVDRQVVGGGSFD